MAKKETRRKIRSKRTRFSSTPYTRPKNPEAGPSHRQPAELRSSGSGYVLPNQNFLGPKKQRFANHTNSFVDNAELDRCDGWGNIQRIHGMRASLLESSTVPSCSPASMVANVAVVLASRRKQKSQQESGDCDPLQEGAEDTKPGSMCYQNKRSVKRILEEFERMPTPLSDAQKLPFEKIYRYVLFTAEEDTWQQRNEPVESDNQTPFTSLEEGSPAGQVSFCESTAEPVANPNPLPSSTVAVSFQDNSEVTSSVARGGVCDYGEVEEDSVQQRDTDDPVERESDNKTPFTSLEEGSPAGQVSFCESTAEPVANPNSLPSSTVAVSFQDNSEVTYSVARGGDCDYGEVEEDSVQQRDTDDPVERESDNKTPFTSLEEGSPAGQVSVCESTAEPVPNPNRFPSSTVAVSFQDNSEVTSSVARGGDCDYGEVEEDSVQQRDTDDPVERESDNKTPFTSLEEGSPAGQVSFCESTAEPVPNPNPLPSSTVAVSFQDNSEVTYSVARGGDCDYGEVEEDSVQQRDTDDPVERESDNKTPFTSLEEGSPAGQVSFCESTAEPVANPNPLPSSTVAVSFQDNSESYLPARCSTGGKMKREKSYNFRRSGGRRDDDRDDEEDEPVQLDTCFILPIKDIGNFLAPMPSSQPPLSSTSFTSQYPTSYTPSPILTSAFDSSQPIFTFSPPIKIKVPRSLQSPTPHASTSSEAKFKRKMASASSTAPMELPETPPPAKSSRTPSSTLSTSAIPAPPGLFTFGQSTDTPPGLFQNLISSSHLESIFPAEGHYYLPETLPQTFPCLSEAQFVTPQCSSFQTENLMDWSEMSPPLDSSYATFSVLPFATTISPGPFLFAQNANIPPQVQPSCSTFQSSFAMMEARDSAGTFQQPSSFSSGLNSNQQIANPFSTDFPSVSSRSMNPFSTSQQLSDDLIPPGAKPMSMNRKRRKCKIGVRRCQQ